MNFDYIIVGAGSAGCVLASRLTEKNNSVLLLEAGGKNNSIWINMPAALSKPMSMKKYNWGFVSQPEKNLNFRQITCPRGKGLGGSSSINGMAWVRGNPLDYNNWEQLGAKGWNYDNVLPYFCRSENYQDNKSHWRGRNGPVNINKGKQKNPLYKAFIKAGFEAGYLETDDPNGFMQEGFGPMDMSVGNGIRSSTSKSYLRPVINRKNLTVQTKAHVEKIMFMEKKAVGLSYSFNNQQKTVTANKEIILSAGAIGSPQLLMCSGIGPGDHLKEMGIPVIHNLYGVGKNLMDHLEIYIQQACIKPISLHRYNNFFRKIPIGIQWILFKNGIGSSNHFEAGAFIRSRQGIQWPNIQYHFLPIAVSYDSANAANQHSFQVHVGPMRSKSRGSIRLQSTDPSDDPLISFNYMDHEEDWVDFRACIRLTREVFNQKAMDPYKGEEISPGIDIQRDNQIDDFIKDNAESAYHPCGTCRMGETNNKDSVTDNNGKVLGLNGVRVVDSSLMPQITTGNLNAPVIMMAEKIADNILGLESLPSMNLEFYQSKNWEKNQR